MQTLTPVLLVAYHFPPDNSTGGARPHRFYKYLPEWGFEPWVITAAKQDLDDPKIHFVPKIVANRQTISGLREMVLRKFAFPKDESMSWTWVATSAGQRLASTHRFSAVISTFPPLCTHLAALRIANSAGIPWLADFRDPMVGNPFRPTQGLPAFLDRKLERRFLQRCAAMTVVSDVVRDEIVRRYPEHREKIHLLWNGYDPEDQIAPAPIPTRSYRVITHTGSLYWPRHPGLLLKSVQRLLAAGKLDKSSFRIRQIGLVDDGVLNSQSAIFDSLSRTGVLELAGMVPRSQAQLEQREADFLLLVDISDRGGYTVPAKIFEYVGIGRPVMALTERNSPVDRILSKSGVPYCCLDPADPSDQIDASVLQFLQMPSEPVKPSAWYEDTFDGQKQAGKLAEILRSIIGHKSRNSVS